MSDERYDRSADMRLLELQREALGVRPRVIGSTAYTDPDPVADISKYEDETYVQSGTILIAGIDARPRTALILGAIVTVSLSVANDGDVSAHNVRLSLPLPADTAYRLGTLSVDGSFAGDEIANDLFGGGAELADIEPGTRRSVIVKLTIEAGSSDIILSPHLSAASGAVLGLRAMRLTRKAAASQSIAVERPFYESDDAEHALEPLEPIAAPPTIAVLQPSEHPPSEHLPEMQAAPAVKSLPPMPVVPVKPTARKTVTKHVAEAKATPKPRVKAKPKAKGKVSSEAILANEAPAPKPLSKPATRPKIEVVRSIDDGISFTGQGGPILAVRIDRKRMATLSGLFSGPSLGMIAHYLVLNALAVRDPLPGDGNDSSIAEFVSSQEQLLTRALITTRLGKTPAADSVGAALPAFPPALATHAERRAIETPPPGEAMLFRAFQPSEVAFVQRLLSNDSAAPFMRAAQLFVGLCANDTVIADVRERRRVGVALTAYAALATAEISRIFLRAKLNRAPALFKATDAAFDDAARAVLAALGGLIA